MIKTNKKKSKIDDILLDGVMKSMGTSLIPVPILDCVALSSVQLRMIKELANEYGVSYSKLSTKRILSVMIGNSIRHSLILPVSSLLKTLPGIGTSIGTVSMAVSGGAATYSIGKVFDHHFQQGGDFGKFDANKFKEQFELYLKEGIEIAKNLRK
ncbi:GTPase domain-containing protein [Candidatus Magnetomorum sp. HK-1]|nr:GTPase domain-containing protein [Candidatus Magnetomorum sp. HK-1]